MLQERRNDKFQIGDKLEWLHEQLFSKNLRDSAKAIGDTPEVVEIIECTAPKYIEGSGVHSQLLILKGHPHDQWSGMYFKPILRQ